MATSLDSDTLHLALEPPRAGSSSSHSQRNSSIHTSPSTRPPLSERLHRFWTERGDFSKFSLQDLAQHTGDDDGSSKKSKEGQSEGQDEANIDWGLDGGEKKYIDEINQLLLQGKTTAHPGSASADDAISTEPLTIEQFVQLKEEMMGRLHVAQQSLYSSQALVALLVAANRSKPTVADTAAAAATRNVSLAPSARASPSRAESPAAASSTSGAPSIEKRHPPGSIAAVEAEFGLDPHSIAVTSIERAQLTRPNEDQKEDIKTDDATTAQLEFANDAERKEYTSRLHSSLAQKRRNVSCAISILRRGATQLRSEASTTTKSTRLLTAQRDGWGLTPGRPGQSIFAPTSLKHRSDEGEQDAWIGYAVPESRPVYRRTALAYFSDQAEDQDGLVFHARRNKALKVTCVIPGQQNGAAQSSHQSSSSPNTRLKAAQEELLDAELFDEIAAEARSLSSLGLLDAQHDDKGAVTIKLAHDQAVQVKFEIVSTQSAPSDANADADVDVDASASSPPLASPSSSSASPYASLVLSTARLFLVKKYQERANAERDRRRKTEEEEEKKTRRGAGRRPLAEQDDATKKKTVAASQQQQQQQNDSERAAQDAKNPFKLAPSLMPVLGLLHYLSFTTQLTSIISSTLASHSPGRTYTYAISPTQSISNCFLWLCTLLDARTHAAAETAIKALSGTATIFHGATKDVLVQMHFAYPSHLTVSLSRRQTVSGSVGVTLDGVALERVEELIREESTHTGAGAGG